MTSNNSEIATRLRICPTMVIDEGGVMPRILWSNSASPNVSVANTKCKVNETSKSAGGVAVGKSIGRIVAYSHVAATRNEKIAFQSISGWRIIKHAMLLFTVILACSLMAKV